MSNYNRLSSIIKIIVSLAIIHYVVGNTTPKDLDSQDSTTDGIPSTSAENNNPIESDTTSTSTTINDENILHIDLRTVINADKENNEEDNQNMENLITGTEDPDITYYYDQSTFRHPRQLQTCAPPGVTNGYWTGSNPGQPSTSSGCSGCGSTQTSSSWNQYCNAAYYGTGTGICYFTRSFSKRTIIGICTGCTAGGVTASFSVTSGGTCTACAPPAATYATPVYVSAWDWRWNCNIGAYGSSLVRTCSSSAGTWSGTAIVCNLCNPPAATNAGGVMNAGTYTATWTCNPGYWASQVTRTCDSILGTWNGNAIVCNSCVFPAAPNSVAIQQTPTRGDVWRYTCIGGYFGAATEKTCSQTTGTFTGTTISCTACNSTGGGYYCVGGEDTGGNGFGRYICPAGTFSPPDKLYSTSACAGLCTAGYYCPAGSTSSTANPCGAINTYCPAGSSTSTLVPNGYYSTPLTADPTLRTGIAICPASRVCTAGRLLDAVDIGSCPTGTLGFSVLHGTTNTVFGPAHNITTPGYSSGVTYTLGSLTVFDVTCNAGSIQSALYFDTTTQKLALTSAYTVSSVNCPKGFRVALSATRSLDSTLYDTCTFNVAIQQIPLAATFSFCGPVNVDERTGVAAPVNQALVATTQNYGTTIFFSINTTATPNVPFSVGLCDGMIRTTKDLQWRDGKSYNVSIIALNDGSAVGIGTITSSCTAIVNVNQKPLPPTISISSFSVPDLSSAGTKIGNLGITDPAGYAITSVVWATTDTPNAVAVDNQGNLTVNSVVDSLTLGKSVFRYTVNVSTAYARGTYPITVTFTAVPRPPTIIDQLRSVRQDAAGGSQITPALNASSPQNSPFTFSMSSHALFNITNNGIPFVKPGVNLFSSAPGDYVVTVIVLDSNGLTASARLTITLIEVNRPPYWTNSVNNTWSYTVLERTVSGGALLGNLGIAALDPNTKDSVTYWLRSWSPTLKGTNTGAAPFTVDSISGAIKVGILDGGMLNYDATLTYALPQTFILNVTARDSSNAEVNGTVFVQVTSIYPRITPLVVSMPGNASPGSLVANMTTVAWTPYSYGRLNYYASCENRPDGRGGFVIDTVTGNLSVSIGAATPENPLVAVWDFNAKPVYNCNVTVVDTVSSRSVVGKLTINLIHVNRPPSWGPIPFLYTPAKMSNNIGTQLSAYVKDPDIGLNIGEQLTFVLDPVGNTDTTFGINPNSGQLFVLDNNTASFVYPNGGPGPNYTLTVNVTDKGIDGPKYTASILILVCVTESTVPPSLTPAFFTIAEHSTVGTLVGSMTAYSPTPGAPLTYTIAPIDNNVNQPFPFIISTVANIGKIYVSNDGPLNFSPYAGAGNFRTYNARVTVIDSHRGYDLTGQANIVINVTWVAEKPFFDPDIIPPAYNPNAYVFTVSVPENSVGGTQVGSTGLVGYSKDPWATLSYSWNNIGALSNLFDINPTTAVVTVKAGAILDYETMPQYILNVKVTDTGNNLVDTAAVVINLEDVNDGASFVGLGDANNNTLAVNYLSVYENATAGTIIGYARFWDGDYTPLWGSKTYYLSFTTFNDDLTGYAYTLFDIDPRTGAIYVKTAALDWYDQDTWRVVVSVIDNDPYNPIIVNNTVTIKLIQCNTISITSISAPTVEFTLNNVLQVSSSAYANTHSNNDILCVTTGCTVHLIGTGFGKTARRLAVEGLNTNPTTISATYGPRGTEYPTTCTVFAANTMLECTIASNVGRDYLFSVTINGQWTTLSVAKFGFIPPSITAVYRTGYSPSNPSLQMIRTDAVSEYITVTGINFGPLAVMYAGSVGIQSVVVRLQYGPTGTEYQSPSCLWKTSHTEVSCTAVPGIGKDHTWQVIVGYQTSDPFVDYVLRYIPPAITGVDTLADYVNSNGVHVLDTRGGEQIVINGTNFGPAGTTDIVMSYASNFVSGAVPVFTAVQCMVPFSNPHTSIICTSVTGMGAGLKINVAVGSQDSGLSTGTIAYRIPLIYDLYGLGISNGTTRGGQAVYIDGDQFGPITSTYSNGTGFGLYVPSVRYGHRTLNPLPYIALECRVIVPHSKIACLTTEGTGRDLVWNVIIGGHSGAYLLKTSSYSPPIVANFLLPYETVSETFGGQLVQIEGRNFGPSGTVPDKVTYGPTGFEFTATGCVLDLPHDRLNCTTVTGASKGLIWKVFIDGQESVSPSTAYGQPEITGFSGVGSVDAETDGGQSVTIYGRYLSTQEHLGRVTYGPSGYEFTAVNCSVSQIHTSITCITVPGTGRVLHWVVQVGNQFSEPSIAYTSYAVPSITNVIPSNSLTNGGTLITIEAINAGLKYVSSNLEIRINNASRVFKGSSADIANYWTDVRAGRDGNETVRGWILELASPAPSFVSADAGGKHTIKFLVPSGFGPACELFLVVDGVPSDIVPFTYDAPIIVNIAPDRQNVTVGDLRVFIDGSSFCESANCGKVLLNGVPQPVITWSHDQIMFIMRDLPAGAPDQTLQVVVAGVGSNIRSFRKPVPNFDSLVGQDTFTKMSTAGGQPFSIKGVKDIGSEPVNITIGGRPCTDVTRQVDNNKLATDVDATFTLSCKTPEGVGLGNKVFVTALGGTSRDNSDFVVDYDAPQITNIVRTASSASFLGIGAATIPTLGEIVKVIGTNLGTSVLAPNAVFSMDSSARLTVVSHTHTEMTVFVPAGDGTNHLLQLTVASQESNTVLVSYTPPSVSGIAPVTGPTTGSQSVTITGANFGITLPNITIGYAQCTPTLPFSPAAGHDTLHCSTPNYEGRDLPVVVRVNGQISAIASTNPIIYSYIAPIVTAISPALASTAGGSIITVWGTNFGTGGSGSNIALVPDLGSPPEETTIPVPPANILSWNDTYITFTIPEGYGSRLFVTVYAGNQASTSATATSALFAYSPPSISSWRRTDRHNCDDFVRSYLYKNQTYTKNVPVQCFDTRGEYVLDIFGDSFSTRFDKVSVSIGSKVCTLLTLSHTLLTCRVPRGMGDINNMIITVGGRSSPLNGTVTNFGYDPPIIDAIVPNTPDALGANITVRGKNFGFDETVFVANISRLIAPTSAWLGDGTLLFSTQEDVVGPKRIEFTIANRSNPYIFFEFEEIFIAECKNGFWGLTGEKCLVCPRGAKCPGSEAAIDLLTSKPGFWRSETANPSELCPAEHRNVQFRPICPVFSPCEPPGSCLGNNVCAEGYEGARCAQCIKGKYYRVNGECIKCPDSPMAVIIIFILLAMSALGVSWALTKYNITIALISIGIDYAQVVSIFSRTRIRWPPIVKQLFLILSAFNVNLELAAPECLLENVTFYNKWLAIEMLPLLAIGFLGILYMFKLSYKACCLNKKKNQLHSHLPQMVSVFIVAFRVLYLFLTRSALDVFNCSPTDPPDGNEYMSGMLDVICWKSGSIQMNLLPYGILAIAVYVVGIPLTAFFFLRRKRNAIKYDQILRVQGLGDDRKTNPQFYHFRKTWSKLYYHFVPGKWYWEAIILCRKFLIAFTSLMFRQTPSYQLAVALLVLFVAFVLHVRASPYITHANRAEVIRQHMAKVFAGDPLHRTIEADMRAVEKANNRNTKKQLGLTETRRDDDSAHWSTATAALRRAFEYNTVEAVLLGCCVLINLAGIMFDSARFQGDLAQYYQREYDSLTYATIILIILSIIYYLWCLIADIIVTCSPKAAAVLCTCTRVEVAVDKLKKTKTNRRRTDKVIGGENTMMGPVDLDGNQTGTGIEMMNNPFMASGKAKEKDALGAFSMKELENMGDIPDRGTWLAIRSSYLTTMQIAESLTKQVTSLKKALETGEYNNLVDDELMSSATPAALSLGKTTKAKRTFDPLQTGGEEVNDDGTTSPRSPRNGTTSNPLSTFRRNNSGISGKKGNVSMASLRKSSSKDSGASPTSEYSDESNF